MTCALDQVWVELREVADALDEEVSAVWVRLAWRHGVRASWRCGRRELRAARLLDVVARDPRWRSRAGQVRALCEGQEVGTRSVRGRQ